MGFDEAKAEAKAEGGYKRHRDVIDPSLAQGPREETGDNCLLHKDR
jgi:hypothetical protein